MLASMKEEIGLLDLNLPSTTLTVLSTSLTVFERIKGLYDVQCILNVAGTALEIFLVALTFSQIPLSPDNFKTVIKYQTFQTLFHRPSFESVANIVSSSETNRG